MPKVQRWTPPCDAPSRARALGTAPGLLDRCWDCFPPLPQPAAGDWLGKGQAGEKDRCGQTFAQFCRPGPHRSFPSRNTSRIYLVPIGEVDDAPPVGVLCEVLQACYSLEVVPLGRALPSKQVAALARDKDGFGYGPQIETPAAHELLSQHKPCDAFAVVGYTMEDLCNSAADFGFVFGEAQLDKGVSIFSFARYAHPSPAIFLRRCAMVLCHEVGHLFGIKHCVWATCLMNGSNHLEEAESRPFALCPVDLRKIEDTIRSARLPGGPLDLVARERAMLAFFETHGLAEDAALARRRVEALGGTVSRAEASSGGKKECTASRVEVESLEGKECRVDPEEHAAPAAAPAAAMAKTEAGLAGLKVGS